MASPPEASSSSIPADNTHDNPEEPAAEAHDDTSVLRCLRDAQALKDDGTTAYRASRWSEALVIYQAALGRLPKRKERTKKGKRADGTTDDPRADLPPPRRGGDRHDTQDPDVEMGMEDEERGDITVEDEEVAEPVSELERECAKARSILNANLGACHVKLGEHKEAVEACTEALTDDPVYIKALQRRAASNEYLNSWSSLSSAQEDYKTLLDLLPPASVDSRRVQQSLSAIGPRVQEAQKKETGEMLDKLKGLGNKILGNFGLSTDNFKFEPNGQGGYSMNFMN